MHRLHQRERSARGASLHLDLITRQLRSLPTLGGPEQQQQGLQQACSLLEELARHLAGA